MRRTLTQNRLSGGGFAPLAQADETGDGDQHRTDEVLNARERFRSHVQQALRHASLTSEQYDELEAQPTLQYAGHASVSRSVQDALVSPQDDYHELEANSYIEYYRPNYNRAPSSLSKDSDATDVTLVEVEQREKYFLSADMSSVHVLEKPAIEDPPSTPNYKPFALRWGFSLLLFAMLAALLGLAQYATRALPNAAEVSVTIEDLAGSGQADLRARGWQGGRPHRPRSIAIPKLLELGKRRGPGDGDSATENEPDGPLPPTTTRASPGDEPESPSLPTTEAHTETQKTQESSPPPAPTTEEASPPVQSTPTARPPPPTTEDSSPPPTTVDGKMSILPVVTTRTSEKPAPTTEEASPKPPPTTEEAPKPPPTTEEAPKASQTTEDASPDPTLTTEETPPEPKPTTEASTRTTEASTPTTEDASPTPNPTTEDASTSPPASEEPTTVSSWRTDVPDRPTESTEGKTTTLPVLPTSQQEPLPPISPTQTTEEGKMTILPVPQTTQQPPSQQPVPPPGPPTQTTEEGKMTILPVPQTTQQPAPPAGSATSETEAPAPTLTDTPPKGQPATPDVPRPVPPSETGPAHGNPADRPTSTGPSPTSTHTESGKGPDPPKPPTGTGSVQGPGHPGSSAAPTHTQSEKGTGGVPVVAPTHSQSDKVPVGSGRPGDPPAAPTQTGENAGTKPTNTGVAPGKPPGGPSQTVTSRPTAEPTVLPLPGGAVSSNSVGPGSPKGPTQPDAPDAPGLAPPSVSSSATDPAGIGASHVGPPPIVAPIRTGTEAAPVVAGSEARPTSVWRETFVIEANTAPPTVQTPQSVAKGPDAPAQTVQRPAEKTPHKPWTFMVPVPSPTQPTTGPWSVAPIVTVILPAQTRDQHLTSTLTSTWTTTGPAGQFVTKVSEKTLDIVVHMVAQEQVTLPYPTDLKDQVMAVPSATLMDAQGKPTKTLMATKYLKLVTSTYTDREGRPMSTQTGYVLGNIQVKPTTVDGRVSTMSYVEKIVTSVLKDQYGRVLGTKTLTATQTPYFSTYYDGDGDATSTETLWGPVTATSTLVVKPTAGVNSNAGSEPVQLQSLTSADYFLGLVVPTLLAVVLSIPVRIMDQTAKLYQPFHALTRRHGAETIDSLCLRTTGLWGLVGGLKSILRRHVVLPVTGMMVLANMILVPLSAEAIRLVVQGPNCSVMDPSQCLVNLEAFPTLISVVIAILSLMLLLTVVAAYTLWNWTTGVKKPPWNMTEMARLAADDKFAALLKRMKAEKGIITNASAIKALGDRRFQLQYWQSGEIWRYGVVVANDAGSLLPKERRSKNLQKPAPWTSKRKKMPFFALTVGGRMAALAFMLAMLVLVLVYVSTGGPTGFERFMDGQAFGARFLFTAMGGLVSLYWWCFFLGIAFLSPYRILYGKSVEKAVRLDPPTNQYSGLWAVCTRRHPDVYLGVVAATAILADYLPVLSANVPSKVLQASATHMACTWITAAVLGVMVVVLTWSLLLTWPHMPMNPSTVAGAMYYALDPSRFLHGVSGGPKPLGGRSSPV